MDIPGLIKSWNGLAVVTRFHPSTASWVFIALHDDRLGRPTGGTRLRVYPAPAAGLEDAMRLAEGMTYKWASVGLGLGGGKAVLALSRSLADDERDNLLDCYGRLLHSLRGSFATGVDLGTTADDMARLARGTEYVHGARGELRDPGPFTAAGVLAGMKAAVAHRFGGELRGRHVVIQGVGDVGEPLARMCAEFGARLSVADVDGDRARRIASELGADVVDPASVCSTPCDIYAPCAIGATLNRETIPELKCEIVAGSANNQLDRPEDAVRLHERGILYAPDYVINAGGAFAFGLLAEGESDVSVLNARVDSLGDKLAEFFAEADRAGEPPIDAARRRAERVLGQAGPRSGIRRGRSIPCERRPSMYAGDADSVETSATQEGEKMSEHRATIVWTRGDREFAYETYRRDHTWTFEGGVSIEASAAPDFIGNPDLVDPEEAFVASLSSCHMLTFLALAARKRLVVERYEDRAVGILEKNEEGRLAVTRVVLRPEVTFGGSSTPDAEALRALHDKAHHHCFIANSVKTRIVVEDRP